MNYWLNLFSKTTWEEFRQAGAEVSGFAHRMRRTVASIQAGDILLCYMTGEQRWVGALKVLGASDDTRRIWKSNQFPARLTVRPLVVLDAENGVPMKELEGRVHFYQNADDKGKYKGFVRRSPGLFKNQADGNLLCDLLQEAEGQSRRAGEAHIPEPLVLKKVWLRRFKCFADTTITFKPFTVLMGENCSGKSSILQAISIALRVMSQKGLIREDKPGQFRARRAGAACDQLPGLRTGHPRDIFFGKEERGGTKRGQRLIEMDLLDSRRNMYRLRISSQFGSFNVKCTSSVEDLSHNPVLHKLDPLLVVGFVGVVPLEERLFPVSIEARLTAGRASEVLRNLLLDVKAKSAARFDRLCQKVSKHFGLQLGAISFEGNKDLFIHANYVEAVANRKVSFDIGYQGSGFLQVLQLLTAIYRSSDTSKLILLDEPDAHLHPNLQKQVAKILREVASEEGLQIIMATHSTSIIRAVKPEEVVPVSKTLRQCTALKSSAAVQDEITSRLDNYVIGKVAVCSKLVYAEDHNTDLLEALDEACGTNLFSGTNTVPIQAAEGKDDPIPFRIANGLKAITGKRVRVHFIRDRDGLPKEWCEKLQSYADKRNVTLHIWPFHELENAILSLDYLEALCKSTGRGDAKSCPCREEIETALLGCMKSLISMARYNYRGTLRDSIYKIARLLDDKRFSAIGVAETEASRIADEYEGLSDYEALRVASPGKEVWKWFQEWLQERHGINIGHKRLCEYVRTARPPESVMKVLRGIAAS